jgi:hypothetical protein
MAYNAGASSGNLILIQTQVASNSASIAFTSGLSGYDVYQLVYYGITTQTNNEYLLLQISANGGASYDTSHYDEYANVTNSAGTFKFAGSAGTYTGYVLAGPVNNSSTDGVSGYVNLYNLNKSSGVYPTLIHNTVFYETTVTTSFMVGGGQFSVFSNNAIQILSQSGNLVTGTFKLFGVQN